MQTILPLYPPESLKYIKHYIIYFYEVIALVRFFVGVAFKFAQFLQIDS